MTQENRSAVSTHLDGTTQITLGEILVVDDDVGIREALEALLEGEGYTVRLAENGAVALDIVRSERKPDLMLLDLMMPVMSGFEVLELLEDGDPDLSAVPIFVVSAFNAPLMPTAAGGGVRRCFGKPLDADTLLDAIRDSLSERTATAAPH
jgi:two-component system response regulator CpxR